MTRESESPPPPGDDTGHSSRSSRRNGTTATAGLIKPVVVVGTVGSGSKPKLKDLKDHTKIIQVANVAPQATKEQMQALFNYVGKIDDIRLYPSVDMGIAVTSKICFVRFYDTSSVGAAQHLTNTVFIDRALIVIPYTEGDEIPDEQISLELLTSGSLLPGIADPKLPQHVTSQMDPHQGVVTIDPILEENGLPSYPNLPPNYDNRKIEEIRRSILVANIDPTLGAQEIVDYFSMAGEVKYFRFCTRDNDPLHYALIEFTEQPAILEALKMNGQQVGNKIIKVYHAGQAIQKPQAKTNEAAQKEIEDAMSRQAQSLMSQGLDTNSMDSSNTGIKDKTSGPRRSRSRSRRRSTSRSRRRYSRSRSRSRRRSRSHTHRRSRSSSRKRSSYKSKSSKRSRSKSKESSKRSKSKDRRRSRSRSKGKHKSRSRSRSKKSKKRDEKDKDRDKEKKKPKKDRDKDKERDKGERGEKDKKEKDRDKEKTPKLEREKENGIGVDLDRKSE